jgi:hypothetical protein
VDAAPSSGADSIAWSDLSRPRSLRMLA